MIKVYIVEDEVTIRKGIEKMVPWEELGYELVGSAEDGEIALPGILKTKPDVLITDIKMPFMNGLELSREVKKKLPEIKIVIISGYDEFEYAKEAIALGVWQYLSKPVTKRMFMDVLIGIKRKIDEERKRLIRDYDDIYNIQNYDKSSKRLYFESLLYGNMQTMEIYEKGEALGIDMVCEGYKIVLFMAEAKDDDKTFKKGLASAYEQIEEYFMGKDNYVLFRFNSYGYGVLIKGSKKSIEFCEKELINYLKMVFAQVDEKISFSISVGSLVERASKIRESFNVAEKHFAYRHLSSENVFYENEEFETSNFDGVDIDIVGQEALISFLSRGTKSELDTFVEKIFEAIGKSNIESFVFRQYFTLHVRFCVMAFLERIGADKEGIREDKEGIREDKEFKDVTEISLSSKNVKEYVIYILNKAIDIRNNMSKNWLNTAVNKATVYLGEHFADEEISLNKVAGIVNVSANHFSAMFSQKMGKTFIEYLTELRMKKAKELLTGSDLKLNEIAALSGYKDSHYFSFLFKKLQGLTPTDYRNSKRLADEE